MPISKAHGIALGIVVAGLSIYNHPPSRPFEWGDYLMFALLGLLLFWLLGHRKRGDASAEQSPDQSFAFRVGKALNSVRRGKGV